jgi:CxxC motif-containing protein
MAEQTIICIGCPLGCNVTLKIDIKGEIEALTGNQCKEGREYVVAEFRAPVRVFTATVLTETGGRLLAVRTDKPVHKDQLKELMGAVAKLRMVSPVKAGQVLVPNILGTGADLVVSNSI